MTTVKNKQLDCRSVTSDEVKYRMRGNMFVTNQMRITFLTVSLPANIYLFKVDNRNTRKRCEIYSKLKIQTPERRKDVVV